MTHLLVFLHILSATAWIGGMLFLVFALVPVLKMPDYQAHAAALVRESGRRFKNVGWTCLGLLLGTGFLLSGRRGWFSAELVEAGFYQSYIGRVFVLKMILFAAIVALSLLHDFYIGPRAVDLWAADPGSPAAKRWRRAASWMGRLTLLLALGVVFCGIILVRGRP